MPTIAELRIKRIDEGTDAVRAGLDAVDGAQQRAATSAARLNASQAMLEKQTGALATSIDRPRRSLLSLEDQMDRTARRADPLTRAMADLARNQRVADAAAAQGTTIHAGFTRVIDAQRAKVEELTKSHGAHGSAVKLSGMQLAELGHIGRAALDELGAGASPMQVVRTEGARLVQALGEGNGGVLGTIKGVGLAAAGFVTPLTVGAAAVAGLGAVAYLAATHTRELREEMDRAVSGAGRLSGLSGSGLAALASASAAQTGVSLGDSRATAQTLAASGRFDAGNISGVMGLTRGYAGAFGLSNGEAGTKLADTFKDPLKGIDDLNERLGFLDFHTRETVRSLQAQGDAQGALRVATDAASISLNEMAKPLGFFEKANAAIARQDAEIERQLAGPTPEERYKAASQAGGSTGMLGFLQARGAYDDGTVDLAESFRNTSRLRQMQASDVLASRQSLSAGEIMKQVSPDYQRRQEMVDQQAALSKVLSNPDAVSKLGDAAGIAFDTLDRLSTGLATFQTNAERIAQQSAFTIAETQAETYAEKQAVEYQKNYTEALNSTHSALEATLTAEARRAEAIARSNDAADKWVLQQQRQDALLGLKPAQRLAVERDQSIEDAKTDGGLNGASGRATGVVTPEMLAMARTYIAAGYNPHAVAGYVGGTTTESGTSLDPGVKNGTGHFGVFQLDQQRQGMLRALTGADAGSRQGQYGYNLTELRTTESRAGSMLAGSNSVLGGVLASDATERPGDMEAMRRRGLAMARGTALDAALSGGAASPTPTSTPIDSTGSQSRIDQANASYKARLGNLSDTVFTTAQDDLEKRTAAFNLQAGAVGLSADKLAVLNERLKLNNDLVTAGVVPSHDQTARINQLADSYGAQAKREADFDNQQKSLIGTEDSVRSFSSSSLDTLFTGLAQHKPAGNLLRGIGENLGESLIHGGVGMLTSGLFGKSGSAGGGLFGNFASLLPHFAGGTNDAPGGPSLVGERGPEIVNLPQHAQVVPNGQGLGRGSGHTFNIGGATINVQGDVSEQNRALIERSVSEGQRQTVEHITRNLPQLQSDSAQYS